MHTRASQDRTISSGRPAPSFPINTATGDFQSAFQGRTKAGAALLRRPSWESLSGTAAYNFTPETRNWAKRTAVDMPCRIGRRSADPADCLLYTSDAAD